MNKLHDKEGQLIRQYRSIKSPVDLSIDVSRFHSESFLHNWFSIKPLGIASALLLLVTILSLSDKSTLLINDSGLTPSFSYLSAAGVSLSIDNTSPDMYDIQSGPGLLDISIPNQDHDVETPLLESLPHRTNRDNSSLFIVSSQENDNELFSS